MALEQTGRRQIADIHSFEADVLHELQQILTLMVATSAGAANVGG